MQIQSVLSVSPLRISFVGGGTDFESYYSKNGGAIVSAAINKYVYVHVKRHDSLFQERYRISYSEIEHCDSRQDIKNGVVRGCLELLGIDTPLQISTSADLPANSGLGSSSSFSCALLMALHKLKGESVSAAQIAEEACQVEIDILKSPIGKQDQYAAAFGGLNYFDIDQTGKFRIESLYSPNLSAQKFFDSLILVWTGSARDANVVLADQEERHDVNMNGLNQIQLLAHRFREEFLSPNMQLQNLGSIITQAWDLKKNLSPLIQTTEVMEIEAVLLSEKTLGFKLLGAGGGGFVLSVMQDIDDETRQHLSKWSIFSPELDHLGTRIISIN
jgi:D-glycero-alpha-D-manno-heptose-7-phosphate kinase